MSLSNVARVHVAPEPFYASGKRSRDLAKELGISEAELLAGHYGPEVVRLAGDMSDLIRALPELGEVMSLTRNEAAVHEKVGTFGNITLSGKTGLVLNDAIDLRLFLDHWCFAFAVEIPDEKGSRRSIQIFDASGEAVIKVHLKPASNVDAFYAIRARFAASALEFSTTPKPLPRPEVSLSDIDVDGFRRAFQAMRDIHEFFPLLRRFNLSRRQSINVLESDFVRRLGEDAPRQLLERAAADALPIMCFVGNQGCIQIHHGPVSNIKIMGPWLNILDPGFNLHLRQDLVSGAWLVRKPTRYGIITSVELYAEDRSLIAQFFGVREEQSPEDPVWRQLADGLST
ncbi:hemin-degrading factor [Microvirga sp. 2YAF29]|uniref:hemin-degrading factor n=1 Tax=Microvirga sp. 2YAF29 TaxID=3233031 RepID=UPI003F9E960D